MRRATLNCVDTLADLFPIIPHEAAVGVDCCGCMVPRTKGAMVELVCNECGIVEGSIDRAILWAGRVRWRPLAVRAGRRVPSMAGPTPVEPKREFVEVVFRAAITIKDLRSVCRPRTPSSKHRTVAMQRPGRAACTVESKNNTSGPSSGGGTSTKAAGGNFGFRKGTRTPIPTPRAVP